MQATIIFPHQLFFDNPSLNKNSKVYLVEDHLYFSQYNFHKQKLILHRASMKYYEAMLKERGFDVCYVNVQEHENLGEVLHKLFTSGITEIHYCDVNDYLLERRVQRYCKEHGILVKKYPSPDFLITPDQFRETIGIKKKYLMASFYIEQRKRFNMLLEKDGKPTGGQWSFDTENRKRLPKNVSLPNILIPEKNKYVEEGKEFIVKHFPLNYGSIEDFNYPVTHEDAEKVLDDFLLNRIKNFGDYEDAIVKNESVLFHSVLTPALNIGLLTPSQILDRLFELHAKYFFPLNSLEGFIRQIIGGREFMRGVYECEGVYERKKNYFGFTRKIPQSFWTGTTGIEPIDATIKKILETGYCHHIERLMVLGNFMLLCEFDPDEVYQWFMELFIDSYDWVMVPNVYGMTQYADGGLITTKPYVSGSNYLLKMSDYKKGDWCEIWDGLYWRFIDKHKDTFSKNPRMSMMANLVVKMDHDKLQAHRSKAEGFLNSL